MRIKGSELRKIIKEELYRSRRLQEAADFSSEDEGWLERVSSSPLGMGSSGPDVMRTQQLLVAALRVIGSKALDLPSSLSSQLERLRVRGAISGTQYNLQSLVSGLADEIDKGGMPDGKFGPMTQLGISILQTLADNLSTTGKVDAQTAAALLRGVSRPGLVGSATAPGMSRFGNIEIEIERPVGPFGAEQEAPEDPEELLSFMLRGRSFEAGATGLDLANTYLSEKLKKLGLDTLRKNEIFGKIRLTVSEDGQGVKSGNEFIADDGRKFSTINWIGGYPVSLIPANKIIRLSSSEDRYPTAGDYMVDAALTITFSGTGFNSKISFDEASLAEMV